MGVERLPARRSDDRGAGLIAPAVSDHAPFLERCFSFDAVEAARDVTGIVGSVPAWLRGSYYVNGPARFTRGSFRYRHWLDGDGMVCALHFTDRAVEFVSRFVRTRKFEDEQAAGAPVYRTFGTAFPGDRLRYGMMLESPVNVSVYPFAGTLLALGEQSLPIELDPRTLETRGPYDFHGRLNEVSPFAAHAKIDPASGHLVNFGMAYSPLQPAVIVYEFDAEGRQLHRRRYSIERPHANHDFGVSSAHVVFFLSPLVLEMERFLSGAAVSDSLRWVPETGSRVLVAPRIPGREAPFSVGVDTGYCLHVINCFEENGTLTFDLLELDAPIFPEYEPLPDLFAAAPLGRPVRYSIDLSSRTLNERRVLPYDRTPDFPAIDSHRLGHPYDEFWMLGISSAGAPGRKFFDQVAHASWASAEETEIYTNPHGEYFAGEPVFVSNPDCPTEAVVIVEHLTARTSEAAIVLFDAFNVRGGPIARLPIGQPLHPGFHASFVASPTSRAGASNASTSHPTPA